MGDRSLPALAFRSAQAAAARKTGGGAKPPPPSSSSASSSSAPGNAADALKAPVNVPVIASTPARNANATGGGVSGGPNVVSPPPGDSTFADDFYNSAGLVDGDNIQSLESILQSGIDNVDADVNEDAVPNGNAVGTTADAAPVVTEGSHNMAFGGDENNLLFQDEQEVKTENVYLNNDNSNSSFWITEDESDPKKLGRFLDPLFQLIDRQEEFQGGVCWSLLGDVERQMVDGLIPGMCEKLAKDMGLHDNVNGTVTSTKGPKEGMNNFKGIANSNDAFSQNTRNSLAIVPGALGERMRMAMFHTSDAPLSLAPHQHHCTPLRYEALLKLALKKLKDEESRRTNTNNRTNASDSDSDRIATSTGSSTPGGAPSSSTKKEDDKPGVVSSVLGALFGESAASKEERRIAEQVWKMQMQILRLQAQMDFPRDFSVPMIGIPVRPPLLPIQLEAFSIQKLNEEFQLDWGGRGISYSDNLPIYPKGPESDTAALKRKLKKLAKTIEDRDGRWRQHGAARGKTFAQKMRQVRDQWFDDALVKKKNEKRMIHSYMPMVPVIENLSVGNLLAILVDAEEGLIDEEKTRLLWEQDQMFGESLDEGNDGGGRNVKNDTDKKNDLNAKINEVFNALKRQDAAVKNLESLKKLRDAEFRFGEGKGLMLRVSRGRGISDGNSSTGSDIDRGSTASGCFLCVKSGERVFRMKANVPLFSPEEIDFLREAVQAVLYTRSRREGYSCYGGGSIGRFRSTKYFSDSKSADGEKRANQDRDSKALQGKKLLFNEARDENQMSMTMSRNRPPGLSPIDSNTACLNSRSHLLHTVIQQTQETTPDITSALSSPQELDEFLLENAVNSRAEQFLPTFSLADMHQGIGMEGNGIDQAANERFKEAFRVLEGLSYADKLAEDEKDVKGGDKSPKKLGSGPRMWGFDPRTTAFNPETDLMKAAGNARARNLKLNLKREDKIGSQERFLPPSFAFRLVSEGQEHFGWVEWSFVNRKFRNLLRANAQLVFVDIFTFPLCFLLYFTHYRYPRKEVSKFLEAKGIEAKTTNEESGGTNGNGNANDNARRSSVAGGSDSWISRWQRARRTNMYPGIPNGAARAAAHRSNLGGLGRLQQDVDTTRRQGPGNNEQNVNANANADAERNNNAANVNNNAAAAAVPGAPAGAPANVNNDANTRAFGSAAPSPRATVSTTLSFYYLLFSDLSDLEAGTKTRELLWDMKITIIVQSLFMIFDLIVLVI
jgi:hypothetical protein